MRTQANWSAQLANSPHKREGAMEGGGGLPATPMSRAHWLPCIMPVHRAHRTSRRSRGGLLPSPSTFERAHETNSGEGGGEARVLCRRCRLCIPGLGAGILASSDVRTAGSGRGPVPEMMGRRERGRRAEPRDGRPALACTPRGARWAWLPWPPPSGHDLRSPRPVRAPRRPQQQPESHLTSGFSEAAPT